MDTRVVIVLAALALAGCGAIGGGADGPGTPEETLTPAPVPEVTETPVTLPPGVTGDGVPNANALFGAHLRALDGESYVLHVRVRGDNDVAQRTYRVETANRYYWNDSMNGTGQKVWAFANGEQVYIRTSFGAGYNYALGNVTDRPIARTVRLSNLFLRVDNATVSEILVDGDLHYEIRAAYDVHPRGESLENFTLRAVVRPDGFIRSMTADYTYYSAGTPTNITRSFEYRDVGTTTVERPAWVDGRWGTSDNGSRVSPRPSIGSQRP